MDVSTILTSVISSIVSSGALVKYLMSVQKHKMAKQLETHKNELKKDSFKTQRLYDRRIDGIMEMCERLQALHEHLTSYVSIVTLPGEPSKDKKRDIIAKAIRSWNRCFRKNRIVLPEELDKQIMDTIINKIIQNTVMFNIGRNRYDSQESSESRQDGPKDDKWIEIDTNVRQLLPEIAEVRRKLRKLLGVEFPDDPS